METRTGPDGATLYVERGEGKRGSKGPFYVVYTSEETATRWGFFCAHCDSFDTAVDAMGRVQCNECANVTKAEEWDSAHE